MFSVVFFYSFTGINLEHLRIIAYHNDESYLLLELMMKSDILE